MLVIVLAGVGWVRINRTIDPNSAAGQAYADSFKKPFAESCVAEAGRAIGNSDAATPAKLTVACGCAAEATYDAYKDLPPVKLPTIAQDTEAQGEIGSIMQQCAQQAGLQ